MKLIKLTRGFFAKVDDEDFDFLSQWKWCASKHYPTPYAVRNTKHKGKCTTHRMHRVLMGEPEGMFVDHWNQDTLDNRRDNLRVCTSQQNSRNQKNRLGASSKYKGVCWRPKNNNWEAYITISGKYVSLGSYTTEVEAAAAYDMATFSHFGEFSKPNLPWAHL